MAGNQSAQDVGKVAGWSAEATCSSSDSSPAAAPPHLRASSTASCQQRWSGFLALAAAAKSFAAWLLSLPLGNVDGPLPDLRDVLAEHRLDSPPLASATADPPAAPQFRVSSVFAVDWSISGQAEQQTQLHFQELVCTHESFGTNDVRFHSATSKDSQEVHCSPYSTAAYGNDNRAAAAACVALNVRLADMKVAGTRQQPPPSPHDVGCRDFRPRACAQNGLGSELPGGKRLQLHAVSDDRCIEVVANGLLMPPSSAPYHERVMPSMAPTCTPAVLLMAPPGPLPFGGRSKRALAGPLAAANRRELPAHVREDFVQLRRLTGDVALPSQREFQQRRGDGALCSDSEQP
ncbi:hypothetical protein AK812_SmicGene8749 [Symbiodinium microadriaticum]|uniref:Uncharacterized protein n=1 Tax=Symbiodinium microadriaticum TaxID=2951 RepID=A0A1Q9EK73_SYMMI|nr:hypothetical protein AK812_SmicGene8749 [Symbiodinium microadriaticum]